MSSIFIDKDDFGVVACKDGALVMTGGSPVVQWTFDVGDLQWWITTIEETMKQVDYCHRYAFLRLLSSLKAAYEWHEDEHKAVVGDGPNNDDLMDYLIAYSLAAKGQEAQQ